jgi:hypothetical protein
VAGRGADLVSRRGDRDEHVVAIAERAVVALQQLVVGEPLARHLPLRHAEEDDDGAAELGWSRRR